MAARANEFVEELRAYIREQEKAPLYGKSFFDGVMAGTMRYLSQHRLESPRSKNPSSHR